MYEMILSTRGGIMNDKEAGKDGDFSCCGRRSGESRRPLMRDVMIDRMVGFDSTGWAKGGADEGNGRVEDDPFYF